jgi:glycosyltransferase involved in cell wall biosynthesis
MELVFADVAQFDVIHFHVDYLHLPLLERCPCRSVTTLHGRLYLPDLKPLFETYPNAPLVSISNQQRGPLPTANWLGTVYHGLPKDLHTFRGPMGDYLVFLGRMSPEKRLDRAVEIARRTGLKLKVAAKIYPEERDYFVETVQPLLEQSKSFVEFLGEVGGSAKDELLGNARALVFPIDWPEPFGLVMIEALACGTPVIGWRCGSVPEVISDGVTGFVVDSIEQAVTAVERVPCLNRKACRQEFEERFSSLRMARDYLSIYRELIKSDAPAGRVASSSEAPMRVERLAVPHGPLHQAMSSLQAKRSAGNPS